MLTSLFTYVTETYTSWLIGIMSMLPKESTFILPSYPTQFSLPTSMTAFSWK
ncbi:hypothetical protein N8Y88_03945 [Saprospiraceae bacterium]|nr:hypothetical protein [Saprospiraceae bacterium]